MFQVAKNDRNVTLPNFYCLSQSRWGNNYAPFGIASSSWGSYMVRGQVQNLRRPDVPIQLQCHNHYNVCTTLVYCFKNQVIDKLFWNRKFHTTWLSFSPTGQCLFCTNQKILFVLFAPQKLQPVYQISARRYRLFLFIKFYQICRNMSIQCFFSKPVFILRCPSFKNRDKGLIPIKRFLTHFQTLQPNVSRQLMSFEVLARLHSPFLHYQSVFALARFVLLCTAQR